MDPSCRLEQESGCHWDAEFILSRADPGEVTERLIVLVQETRKPGEGRFLCRMTTVGITSYQGYLGVLGEVGKDLGAMYNQVSHLRAVSPLHRSSGGMPRRPLGFILGAVALWICQHLR